MPVMTKNFNTISDPKLRCTCGHADCDERAVDQLHLERVQVVRDIIGHSLAVTSGGRCPNHPNEMSRTTPADHQKGMGVDVAVTGSTRGNVVRAGLKAGCNAIGIAKTFVHLGYRAELPKGDIIMWVY